MQLLQLINEWLYVNHKDDIKPRTLLRYEGCVKEHISPYFNNVEADTLSARDIQSWLNQLKNKKSDKTGRLLSPSSINLSLLVLKLSYAYALDFEILDHDPTRKVKIIPSKNKDPLKVFTREEQVKLERYIDSLNNDEYFVYILCLYTGIRLGEAMALTYKDINLKTGVMSINKSRYKTKDDKGQWHYVTDTPKTQNSNREVPLPSFIKDRLKQMKKTAHSKYVVSKNNGDVLTDKIVVYRLSHMEKKLKIRHLCFHCLRHTFATRALENKMDIKTLSEILGHKSVVTTLDIYAHSLINHKKIQMRKIKRII